MSRASQQEGYARTECKHHRRQKQSSHFFLSIVYLTKWRVTGIDDTIRDSTTQGLASHEYGCMARGTIFRVSRDCECWRRREFSGQHTPRPVKPTASSRNMSAG